MGAVLEIWLAPLLVSSVVTACILRVLLARLGNLALDTPNHRSLHETPVPRTGGWALIGGVCCGIAISGMTLSVGTVFAFLLLFLVSLVDDLRQLGAGLRFAVQTLSVSLLLYSLAPQVELLLLWPVLIFAGVWSINLYNFMDGMDGFAGSMTGIGFATLGIVCALRGTTALAGICFLMAICSVVFLYYNWPKARIFLGDAGSTVIGLAVFAVGVSGWQQGVFHWLVPLLVFLPFWLDATVTLMIRVLKRERWWEAHRQHLYQRMALRFGVKTSLFIELSVMLCTSLLALLLVVSGVA